MCVITGPAHLAFHRRATEGPCRAVKGCLRKCGLQGHQGACNRSAYTY